MAELVRLAGVVAGYGDSVILEAVSLALEEGGSLALLGRNGVGKTTLLLTLMGITRLHRGRIGWRGGDLTALPTYRRAHAGIGWVPQERHVFPSLTVAEHLTVAARPGPWTVDRIYRTFPRLEERRHHYGTQLSGGERQMLAIARALMLNPALLLLDEPMEGLAPAIVQEFARVLKAMLGESELAVIIVEQRAKLALELSRHAVVLERGRVVHRSDSASLLQDSDTLDRLLAVKQ
jgi:branched-chain amino acid transport system ATP-binding protein